jgi:hypothetical protein
MYLYCTVKIHAMYCAVFVRCMYVCFLVECMVFVNTATGRKPNLQLIINIYK